MPEDLDARRELYSWVARHPATGWTQIAAVIPQFALGPVVLTIRDRSVAELWREIAIAHGEAHGQPVALVRYEQVEVLENHDVPFPA